MPSKNSNINKGKKLDLKEFLTDSGEVEYAKLENLATTLPPKLRLNVFLRQFDNPNKTNITTPIGNLEVNPKYMFYHLTKDGDKSGKFKGNGKENRLWLNGGVLETLQKPLFITKDADETLYFYKPFKNKNGLVNLVSIAVPKNNSQMIYKTSYKGKNGRMLDIIKNQRLVYRAD